MMFEAMAFKFCLIHIKHQTFNFKHKRGCNKMNFFVHFVTAFFLSHN